MAKGQNSLPDLKSKVRVDKKELDALPGAAKKTGDAVKAELGSTSTGAASLEKSLSSVGRALTHLGPAGRVAGSGLQSVTDGAISVGSTLASAGGIAVAVGVAIAGAALYAENAYEKLVDRVDTFQDATSSSGEQASRMVHVLDVLGVSSDNAAGALFKMSRGIAENPDKLAALGVEIKKTSDGGVDLVETLLSVSDAYNAASDSSAKTAILFAAFGKNGKEMVDVIEQGSARLRELAAATKLVFTDDDIARAREYKIHQAEIKANWDEWAASLGQKVQPQLDSLAVGMLKQDYIEQKVSETRIVGNKQIGLHSSAMQNLAFHYAQEYDAAKKTEHAMALHTATIKEQEVANNKLVDSMNKVIGGLEGEEAAASASKRADMLVAESQDRIWAAQLRVADSADRVQKAYTDYLAAAKAHGKGSAEAQSALHALYSEQVAQRQAADDVTRAQNDQWDAYIASAGAARKLQEATDMLANDGQKNATKETEVYITKLEDEAAVLAPDSPLRKRLQEYIDKLKNDIPANVTTRFTTEYVTNIGTRPGGHGNVGYASGGDPPVGVPVRVGERGPEWAVFTEPARVYPSGQTPAASAMPAGGGDTNVYVTVQGHVVSERELSLSLRESLRRLDREQR